VPERILRLPHVEDAETVRADAVTDVARARGHVGEVGRRRDRVVVLVDRLVGELEVHGNGHGILLA